MQPLQCAPVHEDWPTLQWGANEIVSGSYALPLPVSLAVGEYELELFLMDAVNGKRAGETAVLGPIWVQTP